MKNSTIILLFIAALACAGAAQGDDMLATGDTFPEFKLQAQDGTTVSSADLAGTPYLLYFYPKADTPGCTKEACTFRDSWPEVQAAGLKVYGVSYDSPKDNAAFAEKYHLPFLLLSDKDKALAQEVGAGRLLIPLPKRISYLIGADGKVLKAYPSVDPATHAAEVLKDFKELVQK